MTKKKTSPVSSSKADTPELIGAFQNRIVGLRYVSVSELHGHPKNWRVHPPDQTTLLSKLMGEIGFADALKVRELPEGGYQVLDGHLRTGIIGDTGTVPVLVLNIDEAESEKLLASFDPVSLMAEADIEKLQELMRVDLFEDAGIKKMLESILLESNELDQQFGLGRAAPEKDETSNIMEPVDGYRVSVIARDETARNNLLELLRERGYTEIEIKEVHIWDSPG